MTTKLQHASETTFRSSQFLWQAKQAGKAGKAGNWLLARKFLGQTED
jgi:hypothetical protein